ncbi:tetratricopeptide repeat protein [Pelagicoccus sp. SDUM812005]|uniref:tetratricopeptide repeat protein n=1 Tax=Pelagicoccus sp. SDUM812005 TaxID=3041257 RepID=UPI00280EC3C9|nr:tetratricopeptide repeat protein [Pelagicoccus sp. SDUM812005]MDQ8180406.1 tetratricopeptide repeat protein [Pelagicoccus sp. SDUM812005]
MNARPLATLICGALSLGVSLLATETPSLPVPHLEATAAMRAFLSQHEIHPELPPLLRMQRILDGLYQGERPFAYSARETFSAAEAFQHKRGNCVSFAMLFVALAREVGLDARFNQIDYAPVWEEIGGILVETSHINAIVTVAGKQYVVEGMPEYAAVAARHRNPVPDERVLSHYYNNSGLLALALHDTEQAKRLIDQALAIDPSNGIAWQNLGLYHFRHGERHAGEQALLRAVEHSPLSASVCYLLAEFYEKTSKPSEAEKYAKLGSKRSKKNPFFHYKKSQDALAAGDRSKSIKHLEKALSLLPDYPRFQAELAQLKSGLKNQSKLAHQTTPLHANEI